MSEFDKRDQVLESISKKLPLWKGRAIQELNWMRSARTRISSKKDELFTFEDLLPTLEYLIGFKIPHFNLSGAVTMAAIRLGYIEPTGKYVHTKGEGKHARKAAQYRWSPRKFLIHRDFRVQGYLCSQR
jgi:hypothetical protein